LSKKEELVALKSKIVYQKEEIVQKSRVKEDFSEREEYFSKEN